MKSQIILIITLATLGLLYFNLYQKEKNQNTNFTKFYKSTDKSIYIGEKVEDIQTNGKVYWMNITGTGPETCIIDKTIYSIWNIKK